jgi:hypothetical protein
LPSIRKSSSCPLSATAPTLQGVRAAAPDTRRKLRATRPGIARASHVDRSMRWLGVLVAVLAAPAAAHGSTVIGGLGGDDFVVPGPGRDRFVSSGGVDGLYMRDGERDSATCGRTGSVVADGGDLVLHCGRVERHGAGHVTLADSASSFSGRSLRVRLGCSSDLRRGCAGTVTVRPWPARGPLAPRAEGGRGSCGPRRAAVLRAPQPARGRTPGGGAAGRHS